MADKILNGVTFDSCVVIPLNDSSLYGYLNNDISTVLPNRRNGLNVLVSGSNLLVDTGQLLICGRFIDLTQQITIPAVGSGYLVFEIDLSKVNTSTGVPGQPDYDYVNNQLSVKTVTSIRQDDLHNGGTIYHFNLGSFVTSGGLSFTRNDDAYKGYTSGYQITIADVDGLSDVITDIYNKVNDLEVEVSDILDSIDNINTELDNLAAAIENIEDVDLTIINDAISELRGLIEDLEEREQIDVTEIMNLIEDLETRLETLENKIITIPDVVGLQIALDNKVNGAGLSLWTGTQSDYNAISPKVATTIYFITV